MAVYQNEGQKKDCLKIIRSFTRCWSLLPKHGRITQCHTNACAVNDIAATDGSKTATAICRDMFHILWYHFSCAVCQSFNFFLFCFLQVSGSVRVFVLMWHPSNSLWWHESDWIPPSNYPAHVSSYSFHIESVAWCAPFPPQHLQYALQEYEHILEHWIFHSSCLIFSCEKLQTLLSPPPT